MQRHSEDRDITEIVNYKQNDREYSTIENVEEFSFDILSADGDNIMDSKSKQRRRKAFSKFKQMGNPEELNSPQEKSTLQYFDQVFRVRTEESEQPSRKSLLKVNKKSTPKFQNSKKFKFEPNSTKSGNLLDDITVSFQYFLRSMDFSTDLDILDEQQNQEQRKKHLVTLKQKFNYERHINHQTQQQQAIPEFMRKFHQQNSVYPNFYHPKISILTEKQNIKVLLAECLNAILELKSILMKVQDKKSKIRTFSSYFAKAYTLQYFLNSGWEKHQEVKEINKLRPKRNYEGRKYDYFRISKALQNYHQIIRHFEKNQLQIRSQQGRKKYNEFRESLWNIEKNLILISEDIYGEGIKYEFPSFYHEYLYILRIPFSERLSQTAIQFREEILRNIWKLQNEKQPVTISEIGQSARKKLEIQLIKCEKINKL